MKITIKKALITKWHLLMYLELKFIYGMRIYLIELQT